MNFVKRILLLSGILSLPVIVYSQVNCGNLLVNAGEDTSICEGSTLQLGGIPSANWSNSNPNVTFSYSWSSNVVDSLLSNPILSPDSSTTYLLTVTTGPIGNQNIVCSATDTIVVTIIPKPVPTINPIDDVCINDDLVVLTSGIPTGGLYTGDAVVNNNFDLSLSNLGSNDIFYTYTDSSGCSGTVGSTIIVNPLPTINLSSITVCANDNPSLLNIGSPPGGDYLGTGVNNNNIFFPANANLGNNTISYSYSDSLTGCTAIDSIILMVNSIPSVSFSISNPTQVCSNETPFLLGGGLPSGGAYSGTGVNNNIFNPANANIGLNILTYSYTDANGCTATDTASIDVLEAPQPSLVIDNDGETNLVFVWDYTNDNDYGAFTGCSDPQPELFIRLDDVSLTSSTNTFYTIDWGDTTTVDVYSSSDLNGNDTLHTYYNQGTFNLTITIESQNGCTAYDTINVFNGTVPGIGLGQPPSGLVICAPETIIYDITNFTLNDPSTVYTVTTNASSDSIVFYHPPQDSVAWTFLNSSCGSTNFQQGEPNSFFLQIEAKNACASRSAINTPILIGAPPIAGIDISPSDSLACINSTVTLTDTSVNGIKINTNTYNCIYTTQSEWDIQPSSGWILTGKVIRNVF